ncbi:MAG TPA: nucleotide exchange factor GrpE [Acidimicrobiales bacterium]|nr:nucleotide exchange factor GrpE [Acidimicrobiales bacterium]
MAEPERPTRPASQEDPGNEADAQAGPAASTPSGRSGASSAWDDLREAVGADVVGDDAVDGAESADPELIAEAQRIADEALAEARAEEANAEAQVDEEVEEAEQTLLDDLAKLAAERDDYLDQLRRLTADFDNYRKRIVKQQTEHLERAAEDLVEKLLEVLDVFDAALAHGEGFEQVHASLVGLLEKEGLERIDPAGEPFDPNEADAVAHEDAEEGPFVSEVLRPGYRFKGRVLRPAMVKVRG